MTTTVVVTPNAVPPLVCEVTTQHYDVDGNVTSETVDYPENGKSQTYHVHGGKQIIVDEVAESQKKVPETK